ncbi:MAG TPA: ABC transporter permease, partial [Longimicrobium sp.]|nr:ABC transporter permease [Longimicrobium sp.]
AAAALVGMLIAQAGLALTLRIQRMEGPGMIPFWLDFKLRPATALYVVGLVVLAAVISGVLPALGATGRRVQDSLRQLGGGSGLQLGRTWTVLVVAQVAFAVAAMPITLGAAANELGQVMTRPLFPVDQFVAADLSMDPEPPAGTDPATYRRELPARFAAVRQEVARRLQAEPWVTRVAAGTLPGEGRWSAMEVEGVPAPEGQTGYGVLVSEVDPDYLSTFGSAVLAGRALGPGDADTAAAAVLVNQTFARKVLDGGNPVGRRVRFAAPAPQPGDTAAAAPGRWYEIVGVVGDLHANAFDPDANHAEVFRPLVPEEAGATLAVRVRGGDVSAHLARMRAVAAAVDPTLGLAPRALADVYRREQASLQVVALTLALIVLSVLGLSAAGIYAMMSLTVTQRRREIGIRAALGADPRRILSGIFARSARQLGLGVAVGIGAAVVLDAAMGGQALYGRGAVLLPGVCLLMMTVGLLAALGPARRSLRVHPMEALREG